MPKQYVYCIADIVCHTTTHLCRFADDRRHQLGVDGALRLLYKSADLFADRVKHMPGPVAGNRGKNERLQKAAEAAWYVCVQVIKPFIDCFEPFQISNLDPRCGRHLSEASRPKAYDIVGAHVIDALIKRNRLQSPLIAVFDVSFDGALSRSLITRRLSLAAPKLMLALASMKEIGHIPTGLMDGPINSMLMDLFKDLGVDPSRPDTFLFSKLKWADIKPRLDDLPMHPPPTFHVPKGDDNYIKRLGVSATVPIKNLLEKWVSAIPTLATLLRQEMNAHGSLMLVFGHDAAWVTKDSNNSGKKKSATLSVVSFGGFELSALRVATTYQLPVQIFYANDKPPQCKEHLHLVFDQIMKLKSFEVSPLGQDSFHVKVRHRCHTNDATCISIVLMCEMPLSHETNKQWHVRYVYCRLTSGFGTVTCLQHRM